jgi:hypothetical protein
MKNLATLLPRGTQVGGRFPPGTFFSGPFQVPQLSFIFVMKWIAGADNMYEGIETFMFLFNSKNDFKNIFA